MVGWRALRGRIVPFAPLVVAAAALPWLVISVEHYVHSLLFRDTTMFLYAAWCVLHGERLYDTVTVPDGPFTTVIHLVLLMFSGNGEHAFRVADLTLHAGVAAVMGALLVPPSASRRVNGMRGIGAIVWAIVASVAWTTDILAWSFHASAQREGYYALFACLGLVLVTTSAERGPSGSRLSLILGGLALALPVLGKPTFALLAAAGLLSAVVEPRSDGRSRRDRLVLFAVGLGIGVGLMLAFVVAFGSLRGFVYWHLRYVSVFYRYHDGKSLLEVVQKMHGEFAVTAIVPTLAGLVAIERGWLPRRAVGLSLAPFIALAMAIVQGKGWAYHFIPVYSTAITFLLFALSRAWYARRPAGLDPRLSTAALVLLFAVGATYVLFRARDGRWVEQKEFESDAPAIRSAREAADFLERNTTPRDRVLYYGADPGIPWLAERLPATPYIVPWLLCGGKTGHVRADMDAEAVARLNAMRSELVGAFCSQVQARPPAAIVTSDDWCDGRDCVGEIGAMCPDMPRRIRDEYQAPQSFGANRVFLARARTP